MNDAFSPDYATARAKFRSAASGLGCRSEAHLVGGAGPSGESLTLDVARFCGDPEKVLVISAGLHGIEGFFGSAVQIELLRRWAAGRRPSISCLFLHALNPYGFAWRRRFDENNVDLNRNFLLAGEPFEGCPPGYAELNDLLNPQRPPMNRELFKLKALWMIAKLGMPALRQSVAGGQYDFPQGLFFGGDGPAAVQRLLAGNLERWLGAAKQVFHLDLHTGLGPRGTCKLLLDYPLNAPQRTRMVDWFGEGSFECCDASGIAYRVRGGLGNWCVSRVPNYLFACAEFGTYHSLDVLAGLRSENQAHHWSDATGADNDRAKDRLKELFCPRAEAWRSAALRRSIGIVDQALRGLCAL